MNFYSKSRIITSETWNYANFRNDLKVFHELFVKIWERFYYSGMSRFRKETHPYGMFVDVFNQNGSGFFFSPWHFSVCPWHFLKKCPWQKTPNFARENWLVARDKKAKKMPVKNEKWPWQFLQICKSARDNFWFLPVTKQKVPVTNQLFFLQNFKSPVKVTGFFFREEIIGHSLIRNPEISLFC